MLGRERVFPQVFLEKLRSAVVREVCAVVVFRRRGCALRRFDNVLLHSSKEGKKRCSVYKKKNFII